MKILVVSDTHGHTKNLEKVLKKVGEIDVLIHCGDLEGGEDYIRALVDVPCYMVAGNNDWFSDLQREIEITVDDYRIWITHGNNYGASLGPAHLLEEASSRNVDVVMYGHTHKPLIEYKDNITIVNPGSLSYPRQNGRKPSFVIMEIDREHEAHYTINYLD
ncbi:MAG TPA: metallophosphoesterase [Candidatus Fusicatenibacter merdavium]|uniref:Phosphoesterase n=1 Tax=Candidatus Fusicatenibacter merdavium TaxID=2838600 RepID=A0A9D1XCB6_9FIRM|nr:metallophosphoesterase [Candidatus Fusicatenibacter merdavium]